MFQDAFSEVRLPRLISDGMVLQRNTNVRLWGWALPGEVVQTHFLGRAYKAVTGTDSQWTVILPPMKAGGPYSMEIEGTNHIVLKNILIGDVWVCSGQSNMELRMSWVQPRYRNVITHSENPEIREFDVPNTCDFKTPRQDLQGGTWITANSWSVLNFIATGYFFARALWKKYHVPIGLINAGVPGTPIQSWLSKDVLQEFPEELEKVERYSHQSYVDSVTGASDSISAAWYGNVWQHDAGSITDDPWYNPSYDDASWPTIALPSRWEDAGLKNTTGIVWFRRTFNVPVSLAAKPAKLLMGRIIDADYEYINGVFVGYVSNQFEPRRYDIAAGLLKPGTNVIVVRVISTGSRGGFVRGKTYELKIGDQIINLAGNWKFKLGAAEPPLRYQTPAIFQPLGCFNAMIAPLMKYTIKGIIWYQGESNTEDPTQRYYKMFSSMIIDWRKKWGGGDFPFLFVQLPNYGRPATEPSASSWANIREAQLQTLALQNTGMAVTIDIGEWNDVHPMDKSDVGERLALAAERVAYGDNKIVYSGPLYKSMRSNGNKIFLVFSNIGTGLVAKGAPLNRFEIAGSNGKFVWAEAKVSGNEVVVWSHEVLNPRAVRYAWADNPAGANLYNKEGLPASPFETGR